LPESSARQDIERQERDWLEKARTLARERPDHAATNGVERSILDEAYAITHDAEARFEEANAAAAGLSPTRRALNMIAGGISGMLRDPLQVTTLVAGGGPTAARTAFGRIL